MSIQRSLPRNRDKGKPASKVPVRDTLYGMRRSDFTPAGRYNAATRNSILTPNARQNR
jgi:hypothetical protein